MTKKIVYLSPSLQKHNIGYGNYGSEEQRMNEIADLIQRELKNDYRVYRNKYYMSLAQAVEDSNIIEPDIHVALHSNAGGGHGTEIHIYETGGKSEKLAKLVYDELLKINPNKGRGIKVSNDLYELKATRAEAILIEVDFHDNKQDAEWIINNKNKIADAISIGIRNYFKEDTLIDDLYHKGVLSDKVYWNKVLSGEIIPSINNLKVLLTNVNTKLKR